MLSLDTLICSFAKFLAENYGDVQFIFANMNASDRLSEACDKYRHFVKGNVDLIGEIETALKWISYFIGGRGSTNTSSVLSELAYSASNVLSLVNDTIIRGTIGSEPSSGNTASKEAEHGQFFRLVLTLIDYLEVFAEISSDRLWGTKGKWLIITIIQVCKTALRLLLMWKHRGCILTSPPVLPLTVHQRRSFCDGQKCKRSGGPSTSADESASTSKAKCDKNDAGRPQQEQKIQATFTLKRSGRIIRTISAAPPAIGRTWKLPITLSRGMESTVGGETAQTTLNRVQVAGEMFHVTRPLIHLLLRLVVGPQSWSQWLLACGMDVVSLRLLGSYQQFNMRERGELRFRTILLLHYLLRSPLYDDFTKKRLIRLLGAMSNRIPLARFLCNPVIDFLPTWQNTYFYSWGS